MDRPGAMRLREDRPPKDALPCYFCAINNIQNCTHADTVNRGLNASAPNAVAFGDASSVAPAQQSGHTLPPSYMASCYPEMAPRENVALTVDDQQRAPQSSENSQNDTRDAAAASGGRTEGNLGKPVLRFLVIIIVIVMFFWIIFLRMIT